MAKKVVWIKPQDLTDDEKMGILAMAKRNLVDRDGCLEWGTTVSSGNRHRCRVGTDEAGNARVVRTQDVLLFNAGKQVLDGGRYTRTCGNPRCMNPMHVSSSGSWAKYEGEAGSTLYAQDKELATKMLQYGWSYHDVVSATSVAMYTELLKDGVTPAPAMATREPLTFAELLRLAETLRQHMYHIKHVAVIAEDAQLDFDKLMMNGQAVKAIRRRMGDRDKADTVVWLLAGLCDGHPLQKVCEGVGKPTAYGAALIGACYG